jgi:hypothetical protein
MRDEGKVDASYGEIGNHWGVVREVDGASMPTTQKNRCSRKRGERKLTLDTIDVDKNYILYDEVE